jgi:tripartite ATP-independent transporter DctP family solute receptor
MKMRALWGICLFVLIGLVTAVGFGFSSQFSSSPPAYDDEQKGLGQEPVIKFSFSVAENTPKGMAAREFARLVQAKTNDHLKVELFPNSTLYTESEEVQALQRGSVQMIAPSFSNISEVIPEWMVMDLPFVLANEEAVDEAFNGQIGKLLFQTLESKKMIGLGFWKNGFQQMTSNQGPLVHPSDFRDLRFRILPSKVIESQFRQFNATAVPIPFNQVYKSMETGVVDGGENSISNIYSKKLYQVQKYLTISNHAYLGYGVLMNKEFWDSLPEGSKRAIQESMQEATIWANQNAGLLNLKQWKDLQKIGNMQIHQLSNDERSEWMRTLEPVYQSNASYIGQKLMDAARELRNKYANTIPSLE